MKKEIFLAICIGLIGSIILWALLAFFFNLFF